MLLDLVQSLYVNFQNMNKDSPCDINLRPIHTSPAPAHACIRAAQVAFISYFAHARAENQNQFDL